MEDSSNNKWGDVLKFAVAAVIMVGAILVVSLVRPLVFEQIVPAVVGDFLTPVPTLEAASTRMPSAATPNVEMAPTEKPVVAPADSSSSQSPPSEAPTATPRPTTRVHIIQAGENLITIAEKYSVTVDDILLLNGLSNPNQIVAGKELLIPDP